MIDPLFDPNDVLPNDPYLQIPLDAQPIDLAGMSAQGKQSQWIFPDDIIPTVTSMHGQKYSNPQQAQVATFNDDKRLRVDATVAGGGGSSAVGGSQGLMVSSDIVNAGTNDPGASIQPNKNILGVNFFVYVRPGTGAGLIEGQAVVTLFFGFSSSDPSTQPIAALYICTNPGVTGAPMMFTTGYMPLGSGLNLATLASGDPNYYVGFNNQTTEALAMGIYMQYELV